MRSWYQMSPPRGRRGGPADPRPGLRGPAPLAGSPGRMACLTAVNATADPRDAPRSLERLVERFDLNAFDAPTDRARIRLEVTDAAAWDAVYRRGRLDLEPALPSVEPDALLSADEPTWRRIGRDLRGGLEAFGRGRLGVRRNLHLGVGLLAATSGVTEAGRLEFRRVRTRLGALSILQAGVGDPVVALHGLGGTKASFLTTVGALAPRYRVIAVDLPGFGDSVKPLAAPYDAPYFARAAVALMDALGIERADVVGNSMGGRTALELGLQHRERVRRLVLLSPGLAWLRDRPWAPLVRLLRPELGLIQLAPRRVVEPFVRRLVPGARRGWTAAGVDEFLRAYCTARGRAAFYAAARNIYLDEPEGAEGFWTRLAGLEPEALFIWGRRDELVPIGFARHVRRVIPQARHVELDCGHVPQVELPAETHREIDRFLSRREARAAEIA
jgi:pimeloyl-ACP methyl ester carboxylesterase